ATRMDLQMLALYYYYEEHHCRFCFHYENHDTDAAAVELTKADGFLVEYITTLEQAIATAQSDIADRWNGFLTFARFAKRTNECHSEAILARKAWDSNRFIDALDRYRRMAQKCKDVLEHAMTLPDPKYERIAHGNIIGSLGNYVNALVGHTLTTNGYS